MNPGLLRGIPQKPDTVAIVFVIDGGTLAITTGVKGSLQVPFAFQIVSWSILADAAGAIVVDVWRCAENDYPPVAAGSIAGSAKPTILASAQKASSESLNGWATVLQAGDVLRFNVDSISTIKRATVTLSAVRL